MPITNRISRCGLLSCAFLLASSLAVFAQEIAPVAPSLLQSALSGVDSAAPAPRAEERSLFPVSPVGGHGFGSLLQDTVHDFGHFGSKDALKWLGVGAIAAVAVRPADRSVSNGISGLSQGDRVFGAGQTMGGARLQLAGALATFAVGQFASSPKTAAVGADLLKAQIISQAVTAGIKLSFQRTRPDGTLFSFPSGHTSVTFASATVLQRHYGWGVGIPAYAAASYVAASRIQERRHFLSDVVFGAAVGIVSARAVTFGRGDHQLALSPMATPGGAGVSFSWTGQ